MFRLLIVFAIAFAALWFYLQDKGEQQAAGEPQREMLEQAEAAAAATEAAAAAAAVQSDAIRDAALGASGAAPEEPAP